jgi:mRNA interferase MazF
MSKPPPIGSHPRRGEVWLADFNPARGSEQAGMRPALVVQNDTGNRFSSTTIVAAITTTLRPFPVTVVVEGGDGGLSTRSMINLAQLLTIDKTRLSKRLGTLSRRRLAEVDRALAVSLGIGAGVLAGMSSSPADG